MIRFTGWLLAASLMGPLLLRAGDSVVVVNEIHYHPLDSALEFVELRNQLSVNVDLSGWRFDGGITYGFPEGTVIAGRGYLVVARNPGALAAATGASNLLGPFTGALANEGETLRLWSNGPALRSLAAQPPPPDPSALWSVDLQGDGAGGVFGQVAPTLMHGVEPSSGMGGVWNALTIASHPATTTHPALASLKDSTGLATGVSFAITGTVSGFTTGASGGTTALYRDYLFLNAGNSAGGIQWRIEGADPAKVYGLWLYGAASRSMRFRIDVNGNGSLTDDAYVTAPAGGGVRVDGIVPQASGRVLGECDAPGGEANWSGFQWFVPNDGDAGFEPGVHDSSLATRRLMDEIRYGDHGRWPVGADGSGHSLAKIDPQGGGQPENWATSLELHGTPGGDNFPPALRSDLVVLDGSGKGLHATGSTGASFTSGGGGREGEALVCTGATWVDVPLNLNPSLVPNATVGAWVLATEILATARHEILSTDNGGYDRALTIDSRIGQAESGVARYGAFGGGSAGVIGGSPAAVGDGWVFVCAVFDSAAGETRVHVNGSVHVGGMNHGSSEPFTRIGAHPNGSEAFRGRIDTVFAFDRVLTPGEIAEIRAGGAAAIRSPSLAANLLALYEFEPTEDPDRAKAPPVVISEVSGADDELFRMEIHSTGDAEYEVAGWRVACTQPVATHQMEPMTLESGGYRVLSENDLGFRPLPGAKLFLFSGTRLVDAAMVAEVAQARQLPGGGRWLRPDVSTFGAPNSFSLAENIVINEVFHTDYEDGGEEWFELHNKGGDAADLTGWRVVGGIRHDFTPGTTIAAGGFLVVARDAAAMLAKYPGCPVAGQFAGRLGGDDEIVLLDDKGNPADEIAYQSEAPWPADADRGGASMELTDPAADNSRPEAWRASDSSGLGSWEEVVYEGVAVDDGIGKDGFRDFMLGMLDRGEVLIDDVSVIEDPHGNAVEFIETGDFEGDVIGLPPAGWRCLGNHGQGRTRVVADPDDPTKQCLKVVATGPTEDKHNRIETTFIGNSQRSVVLGRTYRISYRARWLSGSNQVNTRLHFNHLQRTHLLRVGDRWGTPGMANSVRTNRGPTFSGLGHDPVVPTAGTPVTVSAEMSDPQGIRAARLHYRVNSASWQSIEMTADDGGRYQAVVPGQAAGALVGYFIRGEDGVGVVSEHPAGGAEGGAFYKVGNLDSDTTGLRANLRILISPEDEARLFTLTNRMSNDTFPATVIEDERTIYHGSRLRLKGSAFGRFAATEFGYHLDFPADRPFRGTHGSISVERASNLREIIAKHLTNRAGGGYWSQYDDVVKVNGPGVSGIGLIAASRTSRVFVKGLFPDFSNGTVYNHELLYQPNGTVDGNQRSLKLNNPYNHDRGTYDLADRGMDKEAYRWGWQIRSKRRDDRYDPIIRLNRAFALSGSAFTDEIEAILDVDQWMRTWALMGLYGNDDQYGRLYAHNWRLYQRPSDGRLIALPWDLDRAFNLGTSAALPPTSLSITRLFAVPEYRRMFDHHVLDLVRGTFNSDYLTEWIAHFGVATGQSGAFAGLAGYVGARSQFALSTLPVATPFAITTNGGADFTTPASSITLTGTGWSDVASIRRDGFSGLIPISWTGLATWSIVVPLNAGENVIRLTAYDPHGVVVGSDAISITSEANVVPAGYGNLVVSELHYHALDPTPEERSAGFADERDFEFIELMNIDASRTVNLGNAFFSAGITHHFNDAVLIPPGGRVVLPRRAAAFAMRHPGVSTAGEFFLSSNPTGNQLSNSGERVTLSDAGGGVIQTFIYDDGEPWPVEADGRGPSLVLIAPTANPYHGDPLNWRASFGISGNPGASDGLPPFTGDPVADANANGRADLVDYLIGPGDEPAAVWRVGGGMRFTMDRDLRAQAAWVIERSADLTAGSWVQVGNATLSHRAAQGGSVERLGFDVPQQTGGQQRMFLRLRVMER